MSAEESSHPGGDPTVSDSGGPAVRRARKPADKEARRRHLLDTAERLFAAGDGTLPGSRDIAEAAGLAKGTPYLYFRSVEDIFLSLLADRMGRWMASIGGVLDAAPGPPTADVLAAAQAAYVVANPAVLRLASLAHAQLERGGAEDAVRDFKLRTSEMVSRFGARLEGLLPGLPPGGGAAAIITSYAIVIGLWQVCEPTPVVRAILEVEPALAAFRVDFAGELVPALAAHWRRYIP